MHFLLYLSHKHTGTGFQAEIKKHKHTRSRIFYSSHKIFKLLWTDNYENWNIILYTPYVQCNSYKIFVAYEWQLLYVCACMQCIWTFIWRTIYYLSKCKLRKMWIVWVVERKLIKMKMKHKLFSCTMLTRM